jgi:hypothetical protein
MTAELSLGCDAQVKSRRVGGGEGGIPRHLWSRPGNAENSKLSACYKPVPSFVFVREQGVFMAKTRRQESRTLS